MVRKVLRRVDFDRLAQENADLPTREVPVPEWGKALGFAEGEEAIVVIRALTGAQRDSYENSLQAGRGKDRSLNLANARAKLVAQCLIDPDTGKRIFRDQEVAILGERSAAALDRLFDACRELSGLSQEAVDELTEELATNPN